MRLGRTAFWSFALLNVLAAAVAAMLLPPSLTALTGPVTLLICLPIGWLGMLRLADTGRNVWQSWVALLPLAIWAAIPYAQNMLWTSIINGQAPGYFEQARPYAPAIVIGFYICGLLIAAGALRTCFLWLEAGVTDANQSVPAPHKQAVFSELNIPLLEGRLGRLPYWLLVIANFALVSGLRHVMTQLMPALDLNAISAFLFLPAFGATIMRLHDRGIPGTLVIVVFVISALAPLAELFLTKSQINWMNIAIDLPTFYLLFQCLQPGEPGPNRYDTGHEEDQPEPVRPSPVRPAASPTASRTMRPATPRSFGKRV